MNDNEERDDEYPDWIPIPPDGFESIGQVDARAPQWLGKTAVGVPEEQAISIDISASFSGANLTYGLSDSEKPAYLSISGSTLVATDVEVQEADEKTYTVSVSAFNQYGRAEGSFNITVIAIPEWDVIPTQTVYEDVAINFDVSQYHNRTRIDTYGITVTPSTIPPGAPSLPLAISSTGRITAAAIPTLMTATLTSLRLVR